MVYMQPLLTVGRDEHSRENDKTSLAIN